MTSPKEVSGTPQQLSLRPARTSDGKTLWEWRNEVETRRQSFHNDPIPYKEHEKWFYSKLNSPDSLILIVSDGSKDIGQVRFDVNQNGSAEVNISITAAERHKGYGTEALKLACRRAVKKLNINRIIAHIKKDNVASIKAFTGAGFINNGLVEFKNNRAIEMTWDSDAG